MRTLTICDTPIAAFTIVTTPSPAPAEVTAAEFLQRVIASSCGVTLPIATETGVHSILIGTREADPRVKWDGFRMTTDERHLYLDGNIPRGTLYAAYDFAEKHLGYRCFAHDCEVIPAEGEAAVPSGLDRIDNPGFEVRRCSVIHILKNNDYASRLRINMYGVADTLSDYGDQAINGLPCHNFHEFCPGDEYFDSHPEYFSLWEGERLTTKDADGPGNLCLTHPDVIRIVTERALEKLRANPHITVLDISQPDNNIYCTCDRCRAVDEAEGTHAGSLVHFINAVAEAVEKEFPHVLVQTFAYNQTTKPPKVTRVRDNVIIRYCTYEACFSHALDDPNCAVNSRDIAPELSGWRKMCRHMSIWDYVTNWKAYIAPFSNLRTLWMNARIFADCHACHVYESANGLPSDNTYPELRAYVIGKLLWDPYMTKETYDRHINEFLCGFYGAGWEHIRRYIDMEHDLTAHRCFICKEALDRIFVYPLLPGITQEHRKTFHERLYRTEFPDHALTDLCTHLPEAFDCFDRALSLAETEEQKDRIERARFSLTFLELFCLPRDKAKMTEEECAVYEAAVAEYHETKKKYGFLYNIFTAPFGR